MTEGSSIWQDAPLFPLGGETTPTPQTDLDPHLDSSQTYLAWWRVEIPEAGGYIFDATGSAPEITDYWDTFMGLFTEADMIQAQGQLDALPPEDQASHTVFDFTDWTWVNDDSNISEGNGRSAVIGEMPSGVYYLGLGMYGTGYPLSDYVVSSSGWRWTDWAVLPEQDVTATYPKNTGGSPFPPFSAHHLHADPQTVTTEPTSAGLGGGEVNGRLNDAAHRPPDPVYDTLNDIGTGLSVRVARSLGSTEAPFGHLIDDGASIEMYVDPLLPDRYFTEGDYAAFAPAEHLGFFFEDDRSVGTFTSLEMDVTVTDESFDTSGTFTSPMVGTWQFVVTLGEAYGTSQQTVVIPSHAANAFVGSVIVAAEVSTTTIVVDPDTYPWYATTVDMIVRFGTISVTPKNPAFTGTPGITIQSWVDPTEFRAHIVPPRARWRIPSPISGAVGRLKVWSETDDEWLWQGEGSISGETGVGRFKVWDGDEWRIAEPVPGEGGTGRLKIWDGTGWRTTLEVSP